jgi:hypothetical protein
MIRTVGIVAVLGIGLVLAPAVTSARSGGFAGGRASSHGALGPAAVHPAVGIPQAPVGNAAAARMRAFSASPFRHRHVGSPATAWDGAGYAGNDAGYDQGPLTYPYPAVADPTADGAPIRERLIYVMPPAPGCRSDSQMVRSESGGERKITIVRCWRG